MANHKELQKALSQMADGSKSGFHTFYRGTAQYVYSSALLLYGTHENACRFMIDFYQYLYLHLPGYDPSQDLEKWISRLLMERFRELSIGKNIQPPTVEQQMISGAATLSQNELTRVWRMLETNMHFPKEPPKRRKSLLILLLTLLLFFLLLAFRCGSALLEKLQTDESEYTEDASDSKSEATDGEGDGTEDTGDIDPDLPDEPLTTGSDDISAQDTEFDGSTTEAPEMDIPEMTVPEMEVPEMEVPEMDVPEMTVPEMTVPEMTVPEMEVPNMEIPEIDASETDTAKRSSRPLDSH